MSKIGMFAVAAKAATAAKVVGAGKILGASKLAFGGMFGSIANKTKQLTNFIKTPYGNAIQAETNAAAEARKAVAGGARIYRGGKLGRSAGPEGQFWSLENPLNPGYAAKYGIPTQNAKFDFVEVAVLNPDAAFVTREAPGIDMHGGGGIEIVVNPNEPKLEYFHMPWEPNYDPFEHPTLPRNK